MSRIITICFLFLGLKSLSQSLSNGNFLMGTLGWGCGVEVNNEAVYGGSGMNAVVEVDALANLCQNISGFTPGNTYEITLDASRRTGGCPSPAVTNVNLTMNGVLNATITRTNTVFGWTSSALLFTATATSHTLTIAAGTGFGGSTCGMIIDNISVNPSTILPIELIDFSGENIGESAKLHWITATEKNNHHFEVEKSSDGINFRNVANQLSKGSMGYSSQQLNYGAEDKNFAPDTSYYRLKQVDRDGTFSMSKIIQIDAVKIAAKEFKIFPNPNKGTFRVVTPGIKNNELLQVSIYDSYGNLKYISDFEPGKGSPEILLQDQLKPGYYYCKIQINQSDATYSKIIVD